ncbi:hypothetical protein V2J09_010769 [Rumex salicifolius]
MGRRHDSESSDGSPVERRSRDDRKPSLRSNRRRNDSSDADRETRREIGRKQDDLDRVRVSRSTERGERREREKSQDPHSEEEGEVGYHRESERDASGRTRDELRKRKRDDSPKISDREEKNTEREEQRQKRHVDEEDGELGLESRKRDWRSRNGRHRESKYDLDSSEEDERSRRGKERNGKSRSNNRRRDEPKRRRREDRRDRSDARREEKEEQPKVNESHMKVDEDAKEQKKPNRVESNPADIFKPDPDYIENEKKYDELKKSILGEESEEEEGSDEGSDSEDGDEDEEEDEDDEEQMEIKDQTETNLVNLRRTIYLTIMSSVDFEEAGHKLLKIKLEPGQEMELCIMLLECCSQERTYLRYYGLLGQRFCMINKIHQDNFEKCFVQQYSMIHRLETNKLRNVAKFFAHLLGTDALPWHVLSYIRLTEEDTTSSSRIFIKILFQELSEHLGIRLLNERLNDPAMQDSYESIFPRDNPRNTRFAINFFTSIGLGGITENLREYLKNMPRIIMQQQQATEEESGSESGSSSSSESSSSESESSSSSSEESDREKRRKRRR